MSPAARRWAVGGVSLAASVIGATRFLRARRRRRRDHRVFILEYHDVHAHAECEGTVSAERLRRHVCYLKRHFRVETLSAAVEQLTDGPRLDRDVVVLTFDDGHLGNFESAWPVLREEDVPATIFLTSGFLDGGELWFDLARRGFAAAARGGSKLPVSAARVLERAIGTWPSGERPEQLVERLLYAPEASREALLACFRDGSLDLGAAARPMTWDQVRDLEARGIEMGCHTVTHPILTWLSPERQEEEIRRSRERIAAEIGREPDLFAVPNGSVRDFDEHTIRILRGLGFRASCTTVRGSNRPGCDLLTLQRIGIGSDSIPTLAARLSGLFSAEVRRWIPGVS